MEKAGAFITNEGGITSHASIVAREMNKPCIIGTKNATQILKDGDFVEVDADNGIVRILEKEKDLLDEFLKLINKKDFYPFEASLCPLFIIFPWHDGKNIKGSQSTEFPALFINGKEKCYAVIPESAYKKPSKEVFKEYIENKISIEELKKTYPPFYSYFDELYEKYLSDNFSEKTEEEIIDFMQSIYKDYSAMIGRTLFIETLDYDIALEILQDKELLDKVWEQSTHPYFESFELRQKRIIKSLAQKNSSKGELVNKIMFIFTDYYKPKSKDFVSSEIEKILEEKIPEYCCDANFVEWKSNLNNKEKKIVEYLQFIMEARDVRKDPIAKVQYLLYLAASEIARRADLEEKLVVHLTGFEYSQGIRWIQEHKFEIQERYEGQVSFIDNEGNIIIKKANYQKSLEEFIQKTSSISKDKKNIYGQIASPGVIQGTVRIILDAQNKDNIFNQGDILVTSMTRPEFVPLMKKAGAVITNEGGITCHAAIISRELGIPCVIGTKFATQILKDGDEVEVDANNGVVRIINKK
jgi:phosphohistidine swiveling domain-containing protein